MTEEAPVQVGDRVVFLQMPGIFTVIARRGHMLDLESDRGLRRSVHEVSVRRVNGTSALTSAHGPLLEGAGFIATPRGLRIRA